MLQLDMSAFDVIDTDATFCHIRNLKSKVDVDMQYKAAVETVISASTWPGARVNQAYPHVSPNCIRCTSNVSDTALHTFWTCECNSTLQHESVSSTQHLVQAAIDGVEEFPCMWLRGILPIKFTQIGKNIGQLVSLR